MNKVFLGLMCSFVLVGAAHAEPYASARSGNAAGDVSRIEPSAGEAVFEKKAVYGPEPSPPSSSEGRQENYGAAWDYMGAGGPSRWGDLSPEYGACKDGARQSPVNIAKFYQEKLPPLTLRYNPSPLSITHDGHTLRLNYKAEGGFEAGGTYYKLIYVTFHTPSEHYMDGAPYPMEIEFVHQGEDGVRAVLSVLMKIGAQNPALEGILQNAPARARAERSVPSVQISPKDLMPAALSYYMYDGSDTTPPCEEGVLWRILKEPVEISEDQIRAFQAMFAVNARPLQPLNERVITGD